MSVPEGEKMSKAEKGKKTFVQAMHVSDKFMLAFQAECGLVTIERVDIPNEFASTAKIDGKIVVQVAGSLRRKKPTVGDIDLVVHKDVLIFARRVLEKLADPVVYRKYDGAVVGGWIDGMKVEIVATDNYGFGACLMYRTGSAQLNIVQRSRAKTQGFLLNEKGLFDRETNEYVAGATEKDVYEALDFEWLEPVERSL